MGDVEIIEAFPPNIEQIRAVFTLSGSEIFAWGGIIYDPSGGGVPDYLIEHEKVHFRQQAEFGGVSAWWDRYLVDPEWRLEQEIEAHIAELQAYAKTHNRKARRWLLERLAERLASPMYGGIITTHAARARLKHGIRP